MNTHFNQGKQQFTNAAKRNKMIDLIAQAAIPSSKYENSKLVHYVPSIFIYMYVQIAKIV